MAKTLKIVETEDRFCSVCNKKLNKTSKGYEGAGGLCATHYQAARRADIREENEGCNYGIVKLNFDKHNCMDALEIIREIGKLEFRTLEEQCLHILYKYALNYMDRKDR